eukprot:15243959-Heterocapsa_arctica.AAC.1
MCYVCGGGDHEPQFCPLLEQPHEEQMDVPEMYEEQIDVLETSSVTSFSVLGEVEGLALPS